MGKWHLFQLGELLNLVLFLGVYFTFADRCLALEPPVFSPAGGHVTAPALLSIEHPNSSGVVFYTTNGTDPRDADGRVQRTARAHPVFSSSDQPLSISRAMTIQARVKSGDEWSELQVANFTVDQDFSQLIITEVMYHPSSIKITEDDPRNEEFIEFRNLGNAPLDLSGMRLISLFSQHELYSFPDGSVAPAGGFVVLVANPESFLSLYPGVPYDGVLLSPDRLGRPAPLDNANERIGLVGPDGAVATQMSYESHAPWPVVPDNHGYFTHLPSRVGFSLTRTTLDPKADPNHFSSWRASSARLGSPGSDDPEPNIPPLVINELRTRSTGGLVDAVEIYNPTDIDVPIGGWWLSDRRNDPYKYKFPSHMIVPSEGYLVVDEHDFAQAGFDLAFNSGIERCYLFSGDSDGELTGYSDGFQFLGNERNATFGRVKSSDGHDYFLVEETPSLGFKNNGPSIPPLMITEIMYRPDVGGFQYIELHNTTQDPLPLWDLNFPDRAWIISAEGQLQLPINITVPPRGYLICVPEDAIPIDVPDHVQVFTAPLFALSEAVGTVSIYRPSEKLGDGSRYILVDQARYENMSPGDPGAAGGGQSLERIGMSPLGADPANWCAGPAGGSLGRIWEGTCPGHPIPQLVTSTSQQTFMLHFDTEPGYRYSLEESSDLQTWTTLSDDPIIGDGSESSFVKELDDSSVSSYMRIVLFEIKKTEL